MADVCGSTGLYSRFAIDTGAVGAFANFTAADAAFTMLDSGSSLSFQQPQINNPGMDGEIAEKSELTRLGGGLVSGDINLFVTPETLQTFIPLAMGTAWDGAGESWPSATADPTVFHILLGRDALIYPYYNCQINRIVITGEPQQPLRMTLSILGTEVDTTLPLGAAWPVGLDNDVTAPYMFHDMDMFMASPNQLVPSTLLQYKNKSFTLTFDNRLEPVYFDELNPCSFKTTGKRTCELRISPPHTEETVRDIMLGATSPDVMSAQFILTSVTAGLSAQIDIPGLQVVRADPPVRPGEILFPITGNCRTLSGAAHDGANVVFTNDNVV